MENLIFSLNATVPIFLMMVLGMIFRKIGWMDIEFAEEMNKFVFLVPLPVLLFSDLATVDFEEVWNIRFVIFCFIVTFISIAIVAGISFLWKDKTIQGEFIQSSYRSSAALLGIAFIHVMAVVVLSFFQPERKALDREVWKKTLKGIMTNPIIIGIVAGLIWSALRIPMPLILNKAVSSIGAVATPMGLMAMGAAFDFKKAMGKVKPAVTAAFIKLIGFVAIFLPLAAYLGFRREELIAILVMLGSATTVSSFVMAKNMGHEGVLSSSVVMLTTLFSAFTLTGWLYLLKSLSLI